MTLHSFEPSGGQPLPIRPARIGSGTGIAATPGLQPKNAPLDPSWSRPEFTPARDCASKAENYPCVY